MPRSTTADELTVLGSYGRRVTPVRAEISRDGTTWVDLSAYFKGASVSDNVDAPTWTGSVTLVDEVDGVSIAPDVETSPMNSPDPLLDGMRRFRLFSTSSLLNGTLASEHKMFDGYVVDVEQETDVSLQIADLGHRLLIAQVEDERVYGSTAGVLLETVIQQILDDTMGVGAFTLVVDASITAEPPVMLKQFALERAHVLEAIRNLALNTIGANVRYVWNGDDMELTLFLPPRSKTVADFTFSAANYYRTPRWRRNTSDIRNKGRLYYRDTTKKSVAYVTGSVPASITRYFPRYFEFREEATKNIDSEPEAQRMLNAALSDLSTPKAEKSFTTPLAWPFQVHDLFTMQANGRQYTSDQDMFVTSLTHTWGAAKATRTNFEVRGTIAGFYNNWLIQEGEGPKPNNENLLSVALGMGGEGTMYGGELFSGVQQGCVWPFLFIGPSVKRVHIWARNNAPGALVPEWPPTSSDMYKAVTLERADVDGKIPREGNFVWPGEPWDGIKFWRIPIPIPTGKDSDGTIRTVVIKAESYSGVFGPEQRLVATAIDDPAADPGDYATLSVERIDATTVQIVRLPATPSGATLVMRNGIPIDVVLDDGTEQTWLDEDLNPARGYIYQVCRFMNNQSGSRTLVPIDPWGTAFGFATGTPTLDYVSNAPRVRIDATGLPGGTLKVRIKKSEDEGATDPWAVAATVDVADLPYYDVVVRAGQFYQLEALGAADALLDTSLPVYWANPLGA